MPLSGGAPTKVCRLGGGSTAQSNGFVGGAWGADGQLVFVPIYNGGIWSVPETGGTPQLVLPTDESKDRLSYAHPQVLPGSGGILFTMFSGRAATSDDADIAVLPPGADEPRVLVKGGSNARYVPTGHLAYVRGGALLAVPFDLSRVEVTGTPTSMLAGLERNPIGDALFPVAENGTVLYEPALGVTTRPRFAVVDRQGQVRSVSEEHGYPEEFSLSPDGRRAAARVIAANDDIWIYDIASGTPLRLTFEPGDETFPLWTPDSTRVAYGSRTGSIFWKSADGTGVRDEIAGGDLPRHRSSFSPDGKQLAFVEVHPSTQRDIWLLPLEGDRTPRPFQATGADEWGPKISPDGRWMAYVSNETGREEVYVRPLGSGGRQRVSTNGGTWPAWAGRAPELLFLQKPYMAAVTLDADGRPLARERLLFDAPHAGDLRFHARGLYDVTADGQQFVMLLTPVYPSPTHYNLVLNFFEERRRLDGRR